MGPLMLVMKFGGTSLGDSERVATVVSLVRSRLDRSPLIVCSAHGGVTDLLLQGARNASAGTPDLAPVRARELALLDALSLPATLVEDDLERLDQMFRGLALLGELTPRSLDQVAAFGERMSVKAIAAILNREGIEATPVHADRAGLVTTPRFTSARPLPEAYANLRKSLEATPGVPVITGFLGRDVEGNVTTLGRSGSDYTATIVGRAVGADEVEIWTDVSGVLTADPRIVPDARPVRRLTYAEASELAYYGARVIHPATIQPAVEQGIPVRILNTLRPDMAGTVIGPAHGKDTPRATCVASKSNITLVNIVSGRMLGQSGFMARVFDAFKRHDVIVDLIATSEVSVTVTVDHADGLDLVVDELEAFSRVTVKTGNALVATIGERMKQASGLAGQVLTAVGRLGVAVRAISYGATKTNLQIVVDGDHEHDVVRSLHEVLLSGR